MYDRCVAAIWSSMHSLVAAIGMTNSRRFWPLITPSERFLFPAAYLVNKRSIPLFRVERYARSSVSFILSPSTRMWVTKHDTKEADNLARGFSGQEKYIMNLISSLKCERLVSSLVVVCCSDSNTTLTASHRQTPWSHNSSTQLTNYASCRRHAHDPKTFRNCHLLYWLVMPGPSFIPLDWQCNCASAPHWDGSLHVLWLDSHGLEIRNLCIAQSRPRCFKRSHGIVLMSSSYAQSR
jgi:hypothetical protein